MNCWASSLRRIVFACAAAAMLLAPLGVRAADPPYEIHAIVPMTGSGGFLGKSEVALFGAFEIYANQHGGINGRPIKFVLHDDTSNPQVAVQLANELVASKVPIILGASLAATCSAEIPVIKSGPVAFCLSNAVVPPVGGFMYAAMVTTANHVGAGLRYARLRGLRKVAYIVSTDTSGQQGEHDIEAAIASDENKAMSIVAREHFNPTDLTVAAQIARIKAAGPDLVVLWTTGVAAGTVLRGLADAGMLDVPVLISPGNATYAQMEQYAAFLPKQLYFTLPAAVLPDRVTDRGTRAAIADLLATLKPLGIRPDITTSSVWDSSLMVLAALRKLGVTAGPDALRAFVSNLKDFTGSAGRYDFTKIPQRGIGEDSEYVGRWDAAKDTWVGVSKAGGAPL
jgi:branched-chain amino acid transport system substrate-binding protein